MRDGLVLTDGDGTVTINQRSYCELIKWLIVEYAGVSYQEASACVELRAPFFESICTPEDAALESHYWPYYYAAMDMFFGGQIYAKPVLPPPDTPEGFELYEKIEADILREHNLKDPVRWDPIIWENN